jgi:hypothetical protein
VTALISGWSAARRSLVLDVEARDTAMRQPNWGKSSGVATVEHASRSWQTRVLAPRTTRSCTFSGARLSVRHSLRHSSTAPIASFTAKKRCGLQSLPPRCPRESRPAEASLSGRRHRSPHSPAKRNMSRTSSGPIPKNPIGHGAWP